MLLISVQTCTGQVNKSGDVYDKAIFLIKNDCESLRKELKNELKGNCEFKIYSKDRRIEFPFTDSVFIDQYFNKNLSSEEINDSIIKIELLEKTKFVPEATLSEYLKSYKQPKEATFTIILSNYYSNLLQAIVFLNSDSFDPDNEFLGSGYNYVFLIEDNKIKAVHKGLLNFN